MGMVQEIIEENVGREVAGREAVVAEALTYLVAALKGDGTQDLSHGERLAVAEYLAEAAQAVMDDGETACCAARRVKLPAWLEGQIRMHVTDRVTAQIEAALAQQEQPATA